MKTTYHNDKNYMLGRVDLEKTFDNVLKVMMLKVMRKSGLQRKLLQSQGNLTGHINAQLTIRLI